MIPSPAQNVAKPPRTLADLSTTVGILLVGTLCILSFIPLGFNPLAGSARMTLAGGVVIALLTSILGLYLWKLRAPLWFVRTACLGLLLARGLSSSLAFAPHDLNTALLITVGTVVVVGVAIGAFNQKGARQITLGILLPLAFLVIAAWARDQASASAFAQTIEVGVLSLGLPFLLPLGMYWYSSLMADEKRLESGRELQASFWVTWASLILALFAVVSASLDLLLASGLVAPTPDASETYRSLLGVILVGFCVVALLVLLGVLLSSPTLTSLPTWPAEPPLRVRSRAAIPLIAGALVWGAAPWTVTLWSAHASDLLLAEPNRILFAVIGGLNAIWLGVAVVTDLYDKTALAEFFRFAFSARLIALAVGVSIISTWVWLWTAGSWVNGEWAPIVSLIEIVGVIYFGGAALVVGCAWALTRSSPRPAASPSYLYLTQEHPAQEVCTAYLLQGFSAVATLLAVFIGYQIALSLQTSSRGDITWLGVVLILAPQLLVLAPTYYLVRTNTDARFDEELKRRSPSMVIRANGDPTSVEDLNGEQVRRGRRVAGFLFLFTYLMSPIGLLVLGWLAIRKTLGPG
jgi:hypothetical protein